MSDSVVTAVQNLMTIGGYMMIFSVLVNVINLSGLVKWISVSIGAAGIPSRTVHEWVMYMLPAVMEIHLGSFTISQSNLFPPVWQAAFLSAGLAWGGLSAILQIKTFAADSNIRFARFVGFRGLHAALAFATTFVLWTPLNRWFAYVEPSFFQFTGNYGMEAGLNALKDGLWFLVSPMMLQFGVVLLFLLVLSIGASFIWRGKREP